MYYILIINITNKLKDHLHFLEINYIVINHITTNYITINYKFKL